MQSEQEKTPEAAHTRPTDDGSAGANANASASANADASANVSVPPEPAPAVVRIPLRRPNYWSPTFAISFGVLLMVAAYYIYLVVPRVTEARLPHVLVPVLLCIGMLVARWLRPREVPPVSFHPHKMTAPRTVESRRTVAIPYEEIISVDMQGRGQNERLLIGTRRRLLVLPRPAFTTPDALERSLKELYYRISRLPRGPQIVEQIARRRKIALLAMGNPATVTQTLLALMAVFFGLELAAGALDSPLGPVRFGANVPLLVGSGEVFRLVTSTLLHANVLHLYFNALVLFFFGTIVERLLGRSRVLLVIFVSGLAGALASTLMPRGLYSIDSTAAVLGLVGSAAVLKHRFMGQLPASLAQPLRFWPVVAIVLALLGFLVVEVDSLASTVGFVAGVVTAFLVTDTRELLDPTAETRPTLRYTAAVVGVLFVLASCRGVFEGFQRNRASEQRIARDLLDAEAASPVMLNGLAWRFATYEKSSPEELAISLSAAQRAHDALPEELAIVDTLAAVYYRLGQYDEAVGLQVGAVEKSNDAVMASHLATFLEARLKAQAAQPAGSAPVATLREVASDAGTSGDRGLVVSVPELLPEIALGFSSVAAPASAADAATSTTPTTSATATTSATDTTSATATTSATDRTSATGAATATTAETAATPSTPGAAAPDAVGPAPAAASPSAPEPTPPPSASLTLATTPQAQSTTSATSVTITTGAPGAPGATDTPGVVAATPGATTAAASTEAAAGTAPAAVPARPPAMRASFGTGATVYALARRGGEIVGLVRVRVGPGLNGEQAVPTGGPGSVLPRDTELVSALVTGACPECPAGQTQLAVWNLEAQIKDLP